MLYIVRRRSIVEHLRECSTLCVFDSVLTNLYLYLYFFIVGGMSIVDTLKGEGSPLCPPRLDTCVNSVNNIFVNNVWPCNKNFEAFQTMINNNGVNFNI